MTLVSIIQISALQSQTIKPCLRNQLWQGRAFAVLDFYKVFVFTKKKIFFMLFTFYFVCSLLWPQFGICQKRLKIITQSHLSHWIKRSEGKQSHFFLQQNKDLFVSQNIHLQVKLLVCIIFTEQSPPFSFGNIKIIIYTFHFPYFLLYWSYSTAQGN